MLPTIDWIMELLEDGKWHNLSEILERSQLPNSKTETIISFLSEYSLIHLDRKLQRIRLAPQTLHFLKRMREVEKR